MVLANLQSENSAEAKFLEVMEGAKAYVQSYDIVKTKQWSKVSGSNFEKILCESLNNSASDLKFHGSFELISGHSFPDIKCNQPINEKFYGIEAKTSFSSNWRTIGNSVLESTRVKDVEDIYIYFAKITDSVDLDFRRYQDCLVDVSVTHSPRYVIDMKANDTIFSKMGLEYDTIRVQRNPIKYFTDYFRSQLKPGEEIWWLDGGLDDTSKSPVIKIFSSLKSVEREKYLVMAFALFPELLSTKQDKFHRVSFWLLKEHNIVCNNVRDLFTAGGKVHISNYGSVPAVFSRFFTRWPLINDFLLSIQFEDVQLFWESKLARPTSSDNLPNWYLNLLSSTYPQYSDLFDLLRNSN